MHQGAQGIKLAGMLQLQTLQHLTQRSQVSFRLVQLAEVGIRQRQGAHLLLQTFIQIAENFHSRRYRLRPDIDPLVGKERFQYRQSFVHAVHASQPGADERVPGGGLEFHPIVLKQREAECFRMPPVDVRACRMGQFVHFIAQDCVIHKRARVPAGFEVVGVYRIHHAVLAGSQKFKNRNVYQDSFAASDVEAEPSHQA